MDPGVLLVELHSNYTVEGSTTPQFGMLPTQGQEHETVEFTQGINDWSEVGFYVFTEERNGTGVQWVGDHIRPRVRIPASWHWPVGVERLQRDRLCARRVFQSNVVVADHAHRRPDSWEMVLVGEYHDGLGDSSHRSSAWNLRHAAAVLLPRGIAAPA